MSNYDADYNAVRARLARIGRSMAFSDDLLATESKAELARLARLAREGFIISDFLSGELARKPNVLQEFEARCLLAEWLRSDRPLDRQIRWRLAALLEPHSLLSFQDKDGRRKQRPASDYMLVIKRRPRNGKKKPGRLPERARDKRIAAHIRVRDRRIAAHIAAWLHQKKQMNQKVQVKWAVGKAMEEFGKKEKTVREAWRKYGAEAKKLVTGDSVFISISAGAWANEMEWLQDTRAHDR